MSLECEIDRVFTKLNAINDTVNRNSVNTENGPIRDLVVKSVEDIRSVVENLEKAVNDRMSCTTNDNIENGKVKK